MARPMTSEELDATGISSTREEIHESENVQSQWMTQLLILFPILGVVKKGR
jgi:hypothetical protein